MVLQQTRSFPKARASRLDVNRILGISSTLALNLLALLFLLMPMTLPSPPAFVEQKPVITVVPIVPIEPVTPRPPEQVPVVRPQTKPQPTMRTPAVPQPATDVPVAVDHGIPVTETSTDPIANDTPAIEPAGPVVGMQLQYRHAPSPDYPRMAIQRNLQGVVLLRVLVGVDGKPLEVGIERSSGHVVLDREAQRHVLRTWTFRPAMKDGQAVQAIGIVPIDFRLDRG